MEGISQRNTSRKQVILDHVTDTCYRILKKKYTGYFNSTYLDIYNHLIEEYAELLDDEMRENNALTKRGIMGETHFKDLVQHIENYVNNVALKNRYTPAQKVSICFNIIDKCVFYSDNFRDWRRKAKLKNLAYL